MSPEIVIDRVQSFLRWNTNRIDALDEDHEPIANPACYRRGEGDRLEYWITAATWRDVLFSDDGDEALEAARILCDAGLLRPLDHANLQVYAKVRGKVIKVTLCAPKSFLFRLLRGSQKVTEVTVTLDFGLLIRGQPPKILGCDARIFDRDGFPDAKLLQSKFGNFWRHPKRICNAALAILVETEHQPYLNPSLGFYFARTRYRFRRLYFGRG
jgi:hypothetical protein